MSREILTIQAGNSANFIGSHWWSMQESSFCYDPNSSLPLDINHDILFREGKNYKNEATFTPRLVLIDLKDNVKSIRKESPLYRLPNEDSNPLWEGAVEVIKDPPAEKNPFLEDDQVMDDPTKKSSNSASSNADAVKTSELTYDFNSSEASWSTFLRTNLHPHSLCLLNDFSPEGMSPLETFSSGDEVYRSNGKDIIEESIRKMTEDCDYLQGFQLIYDACDGFSSIIDHILLYLNDEYCRRPSLCFPTYQSSKHPPYEDLREQKHRLYAISMSLSSMTCNSTMFSPLCLSNDVVQLSEPFKKFPFLDYNGSSLYETSAILAAAIDALTSQYRLKSFKFSLHDVTSAMTMWSRKLVCSSVCLPFPLQQDEFLNMMMQKDDPAYFMTSISPYYNPDSERTAFQSTVLRGISKSKFFKPSKSIYNPPSPEEIFGEYLNKYSPSSVSTATVFEERCSLSFPFPKIFKDNVGITSSGLSSKEGIERIPVAASFSNSDSAAPFMDGLLSEVSKNSFKDYIKNAESSYDRDDFVETLQNIFGLRDNYQDY